MTTTRYMTPSVVAALCGVTARAVQVWCSEGRIPCYRVGGRWRLDPEAVDQWLADQRRGGRP